MDTVPYRVFQFKLPGHVRVMELIEANKTAYIYIWHIVKTEEVTGSWNMRIYKNS